MEELKLGRLIEFDERSRNFPIRALLIGASKKPRSYTWRCKQNLDQKDQPACVGYTWSHELIARPAEVKGITNETALKLYKYAEKNDEYEGEGFGTSILAGVKAVQKLHPNKINEYRWCFKFDDVLQTLGYLGPIVIGIDWHEKMFFPNENGIIKADGPVYGGHAILACGIDVKKKLIRLHNSWGKEWGINGQAFISFDELEWLLKNMGEACVAVKRKA